MKKTIHKIIPCAFASTYLLDVITFCVNIIITFIKLIMSYTIPSEKSMSEHSNNLTVNKN
ncbi:hypothetical protein ABIC12_002767 [Pantoea agglomerans]|nr:hypothetical protein [Pantoea agglomerans]